MTEEYVQIRRDEYLGYQRLLELADRVCLKAIQRDGFTHVPNDLFNTFEAHVMATTDPK